MDLEKGLERERLKIQKTGQKTSGVFVPQRWPKGVDTEVILIEGLPLDWETGQFVWQER